MGMNADQANSSASLFIGVDIGGTTTRIAAFADLDAPAFTPIARFPTHASYMEQIRAIERELSASETVRYAGIGISVGAQIARDGSGVATAPNLPDYIGKPLRDECSEHFASPVRLGHDTVCGLLAEKRFGSLTAFERVAYLTVSTGTGAAVQLAKDDLSLTFSIEFGHQLLDGNELACLCGQVGCLETMTGGRQIELRYGQPAERITDLDFWEHLCDTLALGLVNLAQLTRVEAVAVSGGIYLNNAYLREHLPQDVARRLRSLPLQVMVAQLAEDAPLVGAALLSGTPESVILH